MLLGRRTLFELCVKPALALAEAGIIRSKLSDGNPGSNLNGVKELVDFSPERYLKSPNFLSPPSSSPRMATKEA